MMNRGAAWGVLAGCCLVSVALAKQDSGAAASARKRPFPEYRVELRARDPFSSGAGGSEVAPVPEGAVSEVKTVPGAVDAGGATAALAERILLQSTAVSAASPDMAIINGVVVKVGEPFAIVLDGTPIQLTLVEVTRNPPQVRLRWGTQEFVKSLKQKGER